MERASEPMHPGDVTTRSQRNMFETGGRELRESASREDPHMDYDQEEEGVEVVLEGNGKDGQADQNVFRPGQTSRAHRPHPVRAPSGSSYGSYHHANQVPYSRSSSFEEGHYPPPSQHYSPQVPHYSVTPSRSVYPNEDVNVISPNHKGDHPYSRHPVTPGMPPYGYRYPPSSPVSRPENSQSNSPTKHYALHPRKEPFRSGEPAYQGPDDGTFNPYPHPPPPPPPPEQRPPAVTAQASFEQPENYVSPRPNYSSPHPPRMAYDSRHYQFYQSGGAYGSFDSAHPPSHPDDYRYYGSHESPPYPPHHYPPSSYYADPRHYHPPHHHHSPYYRHYPEEDRMMREGGYPYGALVGGKDSGSKSHSGMTLPEAANEVDFDVTSPPLEPVLPPSEVPVCSSSVDINKHDVLCGRGGGTNSQIGNRRFRKLVQEFQPTYLMARRKQKPLLARTIVLIIRNRGGRFLKKDDETAELYEVGDQKAEAKTSQALREGLDVRATKSASSMLEKNKKKKRTKTAAPDDDVKEDKEEEKTEADQKTKPEAENKTDKGQEEQQQEEQEKEEEPKERPTTPPVSKEDTKPKSAPSSPPPPLPKLQQDGKGGAIVHPHSPDQIQFRKRRRMRSGEGCLPVDDKLFPDFCPPRADLARTSSPYPRDDPMEIANTPPRRNSSGRAPRRGGGGHYQDNLHDEEQSGGCAGIAMSIMTGAATGGFCLGPTNWQQEKP